MWRMGAKMNKAETQTILALLKVAYPYSFKDLTSIDRNALVGLWCEMLSDTDVITAKMAIKSLIAHSKFVPSINEVRAEIVKLINPASQITADEAWGEVKKAIAKFGMYRPNEAYDSMSELTREIVKRLTWVDLCLSENSDVSMSNFIKLFNTQKAKGLEILQIPIELRNKIGEMKQKMLK